MTSVPIESPAMRKARQIFNANFEMQSKLDPKGRANRRYALPTQEQEKKSGRLEKLSANGDNSWVMVMAILSEEAIFFSPLDKLQLSDCIPIQEISDICAFDDTSENLHLSSSESGPAWSKKFNNLQRLTSSTDSSNYPFVVYTLPNGYNCNRTYFLRTDSDEERTAWIEKIAALVLLSYDSSITNRSKFRRIRNLGRKIYRHHISQKITSLLIFGNFVQYCADAQLQPPDGSLTRQTFQTFEIFFTAAFAFELTANMFLHWFWYRSQKSHTLCDCAPARGCPSGCAMVRILNVPDNITVLSAGLSGPVRIGTGTSSTL